MALLLLALVLLLRCLLDTWDIGYYMLPLPDRPAHLGGAAARVIARRSWRWSSILLPWLTLKTLAEHGASPDTQAAFFLVWTLPLGAWMALRLYGSPFAARGRRSARIAATQEMTVSSLGSPVSTS